MKAPLVIPGMSQENIARLRLLHNISVVRKRRVVSPLSGLSFTPPQEVPFTNGMPSNGYWGGTNCVDTLHITGLNENNDEVTIKCPVFSSGQVNQLAALIGEINNENAQQANPGFPDPCRADGGMTLKTKNRKTALAVFGFGLFGVAFAVGVFCLTEDWPRRVHALLIGALNVGVAIYLKRSR